MSRSDNIERIVVAAHALTRLAALETRNEAPAAQWRTLSILRSEGPLRLGALATASRVTQPGMTRMVGQLAEAGLVRRADDPDDSRATVVEVTAAGLRALDAWLVQLRDALEPRFADLDDDDWAALSRVAEILSERTAPRREAAR